MNHKGKQRLSSYLDHILQAIGRIEDYTGDLSELMFLENTMVQDAVIRNFEIIGEACKNITLYYPDITDEHPELPLRIAYEMRNSLSHGYFKVDLEIVWQTIERDLPNLQQNVQKAYNEITKSDDYRI